MLGTALEYWSARLLHDVPCAFAVSDGVDAQLKTIHGVMDLCHITTHLSLLPIVTRYYTNACTSASPITTQVANSGQWSGSSGNFTIDGTGMRNTSAAYQAADGTCLNGGVCALIDIEGLDGVILAGASKSQRLALRTVN